MRDIYYKQRMMDVALQFGGGGGARYGNGYGTPGWPFLNCETWSRLHAWAGGFRPTDAEQTSVGQIAREIREADIADLALYGEGKR